jgi:hypothetical protein
VCRTAPVNMNVIFPKASSNEPEKANGDFIENDPTILIIF